MTQHAAATGPAPPPVPKRIDALFTGEERSECASADGTPSEPLLYRVAPGRRAGRGPHSPVRRCRRCLVDPPQDALLADDSEQYRKRFGKRDVATLSSIRQFRVDHIESIRDAIYLARPTAFNNVPRRPVRPPTARTADPHGPAGEPRLEHSR